MTTSKQHVTRRGFLQGSILAGAGLTLLGGGCGTGLRRGPASPERFSAPPMDVVRIGYVGVGGMGTNHVKNLLAIEGVQLAAVCDIVEEKVANAQLLARQAGQPKPAGYSQGDHDFVRMCETEDLDLVYTATPWKWHVPVCVAAMNNGKHAVTEVPAAETVDDCWQLVETAEKTRRHCIMMENCCYDRNALMVFNMVRKGMFGELVHGEGGYMHDLRELKFSTEGEGLWRLESTIKRNGNLYPTHGLGPIAQCMDINRGDRFERLVSMSSPALGMKEYAAEKFGKDDPRALQTYALGDVNTSIIHTARGRTITVVHDTNLPRPYSRIDLLQGTRGIVRGYPGQIHIEGRSPAHEWEDIAAYYAEFDHPLWTAMQERAAGAGHGGMDFIEDYRLIKCIREGLPTDQDVYDAVDWSVIVELSERSVAKGGEPQEFPDFTRGAWKNRQPLGIVTA